MEVIMNEMPLVSIIIPVYNVEKWLSRCIESVINQSYRKLEIILVDDGSKDKSGSLCDNYAKKDSRIKVIHKENGGLSDARNAGIDIMTGTYVAFVDSDDWIENCFIEQLAQNMFKHDCDIAGCEYRRTEGIQSESSIDRSVTEKTYDREEAFSALIDNSIQQVVWNKLYKRQILDGIMFEKGKYHEDEFWSYQVFARIQKYVAIDYVGYNYFQRSDSIMGEKYSIKRLDAIEAKYSRQLYVERYMPEFVSKAKINLLFSCMYHGQLALKSLTGSEKEKAILYLSSITKKQKVTKNEFQRLSGTHKVWIAIMRVSFKAACCIRNLCKVGV